MKMLKRNQVIIFVIALMMVSAGYLNYSSLHNEEDIITSAQLNETHHAGIGDAQLVSGNVIENEIISDENVVENAISENIISKESNNVTNDNIINNVLANTINNTTLINTISTNTQVKTTQTSSNATEIEQYFTSSKLNRDKMYSQMIESYQKILENESISNDQKAIAQTEIKKINDVKNAIMIAENLIKLKDFDDVIILVNEESINVVVKTLELSQEQIAQIQNIISRELKAELTNIHISAKSGT